MLHTEPSPGEDNVVTKRSPRLMADTVSRLTEMLGNEPALCEREHARLLSGGDEREIEVLEAFLIGKPGDVQATLELSFLSLRDLASVAVQSPQIANTCLRLSRSEHSGGWYGVARF